MVKFNIKNAGKLVAPVGGVTAGFVGASYIKGMIPIEDNKIKDAILVAAGLLMVMYSKNKLGAMAGIGFGIAASGGVGLAKILLPDLPISGAQIAGGERYIMLPENNEYAMSTQSGGGTGAQIAGDDGYNSTMY